MSNSIGKIRDKCIEIQEKAALITLAMKSLRERIPIGKSPPPATTIRPANTAKMYQFPNRMKRAVNE